MELHTLTRVACFCAVLTPTINYPSTCIYVAMLCLSVMFDSLPVYVMFYCAAMIRALKALQDKIRSLELERVAAADKFHHLAQETQRQVRGTERAVQVEQGSPLLLSSSHASPLPGYPSSSSPEQEGKHCVVSPRSRNRMVNIFIST